MTIEPHRHCSVCQEVLTACIEMESDPRVVGDCGNCGLIYRRSLRGYSLKYLEWEKRKAIADD